MEEGKIIPAENATSGITKPSRKQKRAELKKKEFILAYLESKNATKAYQKVFKCRHSTASARGHELLKTIPFDELLELGGLTDAIIKEKLQEGLFATKPYGKDNIIHPDYATRHSYVTTALKLKKRLQDDKQVQPIMQGLQIVIQK